MDRNLEGWEGIDGEPKSLPSRERGSKPVPRPPRLPRIESLPSRERGSKPLTFATLASLQGRSPRGSVDRNLVEQSAQHALGRRSPRGSVDRNVEIPRRIVDLQRSLPSRERGSKLDVAPNVFERGDVAPLAGAWIETGIKRLHEVCRYGSLPSRERGSKQSGQSIDADILGRSPRGSVDRNTLTIDGAAITGTSLPSRERGSKLRTRGPSIAGGCRSPRGSVDRNLSDTLGALLTARRSPRGSVDRNDEREELRSEALCRSPRGSVDRNLAGAGCYLDVGVAPLAGAWIETSPREWRCRSTRVAPLAGAWIETSTMRRRGNGTESLPSRERGSKLVLRCQRVRSGRSLPSRERGSKPFPPTISA